MDTMLAILKADEARARGAEVKVFDWNKAARLIKKTGCKHAEAGLSEDWEWTGGTIFDDGAPVMDEYTYLASIWATPVIRIDDEDVECWKLESKTAWDADTKWPQSALDILGLQKGLQ